MTKRFALLLFLLLVTSAFSQTTTTYASSTGSISSTFVISMNLDAGGSATVYANLGPNCYYPGPCTSAYSTVHYSLADGSTASFYPVSLTFASDGSPTGPPPAYRRGYIVETNGDFTATDSLGRPVTLNDATAYIHTVACHQPRGTCAPKKVYDSGSLTVTQ